MSLLRSLLVLLHVGDKGFGKHYLKILWFSEFLIILWFCKNWKCFHFESKLENTKFLDKLIKISFWKWRLENPLILLPSRIQTWPRIRDKQKYGEMVCVNPKPVLCLWIKYLWKSAISITIRTSVLIFISSHFTKKVGKPTLARRGPWKGGRMSLSHQ